MDANRPELDDAARLIQRARRRKRIWLFTAIALAPILLPLSYLGSLGVLCWGQSSGALSNQTMSRIPEWYVAPYSAYMNHAGPGSWHVLKFLVWCNWLGDHNDTWEVTWEEHRAEYEELLREAEGR